MGKYFFETETDSPFADPEDRVDGKVKVTGAAKYAAEYDIPDLVHGVIVTGTIAKGTIKSINTKSAEKAPGVLSVITYKNRPHMTGWDDRQEKDPRVPGEEFRPYFNEKIYFSGQPVALVVADTLERARHAATLVNVEYNKEASETNTFNHLTKAIDPPKKPEGNPERGDEATAYNNSAVKVDVTYKLHPHIHNPIEPHAAIAIWDGDDKLMFYNKAQWVQGTRDALVKAFGLKKENVRVISKFVGGAFGGASRAWPHEMSAAIAARKLKRPVKVVLGRDDLFTMVGHRPEALQRIKLGAAADGTLQSIYHEAYGHTSTYEQFSERIIDCTKFLYQCDHVKTSYKLVPLDVGTPTYTRGPGETSGVFALETAMDELAVELNMDPVELRMKNYADEDPEKKLPWSGKNLDECYKKGAESFGWNKRSAKPGDVREGDWLIGMGMSSAIYGAKRMPATAKIILKANGNMIVQTATADTGPGTYTIMTQIAAEASGYPQNRITFDLGDSAYPQSPGQFGSMTTASVGSAVHDVCEVFKLRLAELAMTSGGTDFSNKKADDIITANGFVWPKGNEAAQISYTDVLKKSGLPELEIIKESKSGPEQTKYSSQCFGASFVEVKVHAYTGTVKISRVTSVIDNGKVINKKTARNQVLGCVVWGIGMALMEEAVIDHRYGRYVNSNLADYHIAVNADVPETNVIFIDKPDYIVDPMGAKGLGEIPLVGFAAAVVNAVYNATGKRIRELPVTPDKLI